MSALVDVDALETLARRLAAAELRSPRDWGGIVYAWAERSGVRGADAWAAFPEIAERELGRRTLIAAGRGELHGSHWPLALDIEMRETA